MRHNTNVTKCKSDKIQIRQNAKVPNINNPKPPYSRPPPFKHWFSIEHQVYCFSCILVCLYMGFLHFVLFAFCHNCILLHLHYVLFAFCLICILSGLHFVSFAFCLICILLYLQYVGFAFCQICILSFFCILSVCILSNLHFVWIPFGPPPKNILF